MTRVLLTGAGGFVGSHALRHVLTTTDWEVVCPVTFTHRGISDRIRLALDHFPDANQRVEVIRCDLASPISPVTDAVFGPIDYVINFASESHVDRSISDPAPFILNNVALITHLLDWARTREDLQAFVQISTDEVYGPAEPGTAHREWTDINRPSNPYSASKAAQEAVLFSYWRTYNLPVVLTNTMNIIGETQDKEKFVPATLRRLLAGEKAIIHASPDGVPGSRCYLHARNQASGVLYALAYALDKLIDPGTCEGLRYMPGLTIQPFRFHIVGDEIDNLTMAYMIGLAAGLNPVESDFILESFHESRPGHDLRYALDGSRMRSIGWTPPTPLDVSLGRTIAWTMRHPEWLA